MTSIVINDVSPIVQSSASAGQTVFTYNFPIYDQDDLKVYQRGASDTPSDTADLLTITTEYTVTGVGVAGGGTIVLVTPATLNDVITIVRDAPIERQSLYVNQGQFTSDAVNLDFNTQTIFSSDLEMDIRNRGVYYNYSAIVAAKDNYLPVLGASEFWMKNSGNTAFIAATISEDPGASTLRSELASQTALAPGSDLIGVYTNEVAGTTLTNYLNTVEPPISDSLAIVENAADTTKRIKFDASGITTLTTRTITMPDNNVDLANLAQATTTARGTAEIATDAEITAGTNDTNFITPKGLHDNHSRALQTVSFFKTSLVDCTVAIPYDDTIPQQTEGTEVMTLAITPIRSDSSLRIDVVVTGSSRVANFYAVCALFRDAGADSISACASTCGGTTNPVTVTFSAIISSAAAAASTFKVRVGPQSIGGGEHFEFNGHSGSRVLGGVAASSIIITEFI